MTTEGTQFPVVNARKLDFPPTPGFLFMEDPAGVREQWQLAPHSGFLHGPTGSGGLRPPFIYRPAGGHSSNRLWNAPSAGIADGGCNPPLPVLNLRAKIRRGWHLSICDFCLLPSKADSMDRPGLESRGCRLAGLEPRAPFPVCVKFWKPPANFLRNAR